MLPLGLHDGERQAIKDIKTYDATMTQFSLGKMALLLMNTMWSPKSHPISVFPLFEFELNIGSRCTLH